MSALMTPEDRAEWLEWRRHGITATDAAKIVGLSPWGSPWTVWADKVGLVADDQDVTDAMEFGLRAEQMLGTWFTDRTGLVVRGSQERVTHPEDTWARATLDGTAIASGGDVVGGVEYKTTSDGTAAEWTENGVPLHYACQVQWQMYCTGLDTTYLPTLHLAHGRLEFAVHEIRRDDDDIATLRAAAAALWSDILAGNAPEVDGRAATGAVLDAAWPGLAEDALEADDALVAAVADLVHLKDDLGRLEDALTLAENRIKAALADHTTITHGTDAKGKPVVLLTWKPQGRTGFDHKAALERYPRSLERYITTTTYRVLRPKKQKEK